MRINNRIKEYPLVNSKEKMFSHGMHNNSDSIVSPIQGLSLNEYRTKIPSAEPISLLNSLQKQNK